MVDLKPKTPITSPGTTDILFGAQSQAAAEPDTYAQSAVGAMSQRHTGFGVVLPAYDYFAATTDGLGNVTQVAYYSGGSGGTNVATLVMTYNAYNNITTAVYHTGGSGGPIIATLTYAYDVSQTLTSVTRS